MTFIFTNPPASDRRAFISALHHWAGKPRDKFSLTFPPCNEIAGGDDENAILAQVFSAVASGYPLHDATRSLTIIQAAIDKHMRRFDLMWADSRGVQPRRDPERNREKWKETRRYEWMLCILCMWHDAIFDDFMEAGIRHPERTLPHLDLEEA